MSRQGRSLLGFLLAAVAACSGAVVNYGGAPSLQKSTPAAKDQGPGEPPAQGGAPSIDAKEPGQAPPTHGVAETFREPLPDTVVLAQGSASENANLGAEACERKVRSEKMPFVAASPKSGISSSMRIAGPVAGVEFQVAPERFPWGYFDCRLGLALFEWAQVLSEHDVVRARVDNFYRPSAKLPGQRSKKSQHAYGLAIDLVSVTLKGGLVLDVERDFHGKIGEPVCGPSAYVDPLTREAVLLRNLLCDIARRGTFHHILTPNHDYAHRNHFHLDIKRENSWFSVH